MFGAPNNREGRMPSFPFVQPSPTIESWAPPHNSLPELSEPCDLLTSVTLGILASRSPSTRRNAA